MTCGLLVPFAFAAIWSANRTRVERETEVEEQAGSIAHTAAAYLNEYLNGLDSMASALTRHPAVITLDRAQSDDDFVRRLLAEGIDVRRVTPRGEEARFHQKYAVLDAKLVVTGSYNWTVQGDIANHENVVILRHEPAARAFQENFEKTWQDKELSQP